MSKNKSVIVWAVDPYYTEKSLVVNSALYLKKLARDLNAVVKPIYLLSPHNFSLPTDYFIPPTTEDFAYKAQNDLNEVLKKFKFDNFLPGTVLMDQSTSLRGSVNAFVENARDEKAICIFATTHARKGLPRFWLGSFVETLLMYSPIPVVALNPSTKTNINITSILFPTDFSKPSQKTLQKILPLAKSLDAKLYILHVIRNDLVAFGMEYYSGVTVDFYSKAMREIKHSAEKRMNTMTEKCKESGVRCEGIIVDTPQSITDAILKVSKSKKIKMVAMAAVSGPIENLILGGVARQVVRYSKCPTWVVH